MREMVLSSLGAEMLVQINSSREIHKREKREGKKNDMIVLHYAYSYGWILVNPISIN